VHTVALRGEGCVGWDKESGTGCAWLLCRVRATLLVGDLLEILLLDRQLRLVVAHTAQPLPTSATSYDGGQAAIGLNIDLQAMQLDEVVW
tara:strand:- start:123 stop:392 length:270 start_codon:yes stop_codon:yes gene_type:complete